MEKSVKMGADKRETGQRWYRPILAPSTSSPTNSLPKSSLPKPHQGMILLSVPEFKPVTLRVT